MSKTVFGFRRSLSAERQWEEQNSRDYQFENRALLQAHLSAPVATKVTGSPFEREKCRMDLANVKSLGLYCAHEQFAVLSRHRKNAWGIRDGRAEVFGQVAETKPGSRRIQLESADKMSKLPDDVSRLSIARDVNGPFPAVTSTTVFRRLQSNLNAMAFGLKGANRYTRRGLVHSWRGIKPVSPPPGEHGAWAVYVFRSDRTDTCKAILLRNGGGTAQGGSVLLARQSFARALPAISPERSPLSTGLGANEERPSAAQSRIVRRRLRKVPVCHYMEDASPCWPA